MSLSTLKPIGFIPTANPEAARAFYQDTLGLTLEHEDQFALVFRSGANMLRVVCSGDFPPHPFTIYGWEAPDIEATIDALTAKGVVFERFGFFEQDARGIWAAPNGNKVAWFKDPDGNTLSLSKHD